MHSPPSGLVMRSAGSATRFTRLDVGVFRFGGGAGSGARAAACFPLLAREAGIASTI